MLTDSPALVAYIHESIFLSLRCVIIKKMFLYGLVREAETEKLGCNVTPFRVLNSSTCTRHEDEDIN
jgi:hypothetical protein